MSTVAGQCDARRVPFVLFGAGGVGAALLEQIVSARKLHEERYGVRFDPVAVCDSSAAVSGGNSAGLSDEEIAAIIAHKAGGGKLSAHSGSVLAKADGQSASAFLESVVDKYGKADAGTIVVDCTASDATVPALISASKGLRAVSANKKPFASSMDTFTQLALQPSSPARVRYEATVGAGLPVIAALQRVVGAHDGVTLISGSFSGTLGYVMSGLQVRLASPSPSLSLARSDT